MDFFLGILFLSSMGAVPAAFLWYHAYPEIFFRHYAFRSKRRVRRFVKRAKALGIPESDIEYVIGVNNFRGAKILNGSPGKAHLEGMEEYAKRLMRDQRVDCFDRLKELEDRKNLADLRAWAEENKELLEKEGIEVK